MPDLAVCLTSALEGKAQLAVGVILVAGYVAYAAYLILTALHR